MRLAAGALGLLAFAVPAFAADTPSGLPVPRFVSLKFEEVNGRAGPSDQHPIVWTYHRRGLPMLVVAETENWRRVRDPDGELVWMHRRTLDGRRTAMALEEVSLLTRPEAGSGIRAVVEPGVVAQIQSCRDGWVRVTAGDHSGWTDAAAFWGAECGDAASAGGALQAGLAR
jgi:SH3-like domain-containing protein